MGPDDVVLAAPGTYLQLLAEADPTTASRTHVPAASVGWFWGVAAYPPGALMPVLPDWAQTVRVVAAREDAPVPPPAGHQLTGRSCATLVCVEVYARPAR